MSQFLLSDSIFIRVTFVLYLWTHIKIMFFQAFCTELFSSFPQKRKWNVFHPISQIKSVRHFLWLRWFPCSITNIVQNPNTPQHFRSPTYLELTFFIEFFLLFSLGNQKYIFVDSGCFVIFVLSLVFLVSKRVLAP